MEKLSKNTYANFKAIIYQAASLTFENSKKYIISFTK